jgi:glycosyltransferase involved in cell wall biosynthesis
MPASTATAKSLLHASASSTPPPIGIAIPTFNRTDVLLRCFEHLERQTWKNFEVVVLDDGSTDTTPQLLHKYAERTPLRIRYARQNNAGPAGARNHAISLITAPICLMIGDDIMAAPDLVEKHVAFHQLNPDRSALALGYTRWSHEGQTVTPFMRWLEEESPLQFAYADLLKGVAPSWQHFYTSNLSGKTELLRANPFSERFTHYGMEDIELGYRLDRQAELTMTFLPEAVGEHIHPTDVAHSCRRLVTAGFASHEFFKAWPELEPKEPPADWKGKLRKRLLERGIGLGILRQAATIATRFKCPNALLQRTLLLHHESGWRQAQARSR